MPLFYGSVNWSQTILSFELLGLAEYMNEMESDCYFFLLFSSYAFKWPIIGLDFKPIPQLATIYLRESTVISKRTSQISIAYFIAMDLISFIANNRNLGITINVRYLLTCVLKKKKFLRLLANIIVWIRYNISSSQSPHSRSTTNTEYTLSSWSDQLYWIVY